MSAIDTIVIQGARQHNLKNISLDLPRNRLVVLTGLSGSGKTTLAFDTLYAEGQRRYVESLSTYARQFLERLQKPDVDLIEGLSPAIAIEQKSTSHNPRSTVGTVTEIYDFIRLLYARTGTAYCHQCGRPIVSQSIDEMVEAVMQRPEGSRLMILAPVALPVSGGFKELLKRLRKDGFARLRLDGQVVDLETARDFARPPASTVEVVVDRLVLNEKVRNRLADSMELAIAKSDGQVEVVFIGNTMQDIKEKLSFSEKAVCIQCGIRYPECTPASFSFNSPHGACPDCGGLGVTRGFAPHKIVPNPNLSLREGAVGPWSKRSSVAFAEFLEALTAFYKVDIYTPYRGLPEAFKDILMHGSKEQEIPFTNHTGKTPKKILQPFEGIIPQLEKQLAEETTPTGKNALSAYMDETVCSGCLGTRLRRESLQIKIDNLSVADLTARSIGSLRDFFSTFEPEGQAGVVSSKIVAEIASRLSFLSDVGLSYLTLNRPGPHPVRRREPAYPAGHPDWFEADRRSLRFGRAQHRPPSTGQPAPVGGPDPHARHGQFGSGGGT